MTELLTVGRTVADAEELLKARHIAFTVELTRPTRHFFQTDEGELRVVRERRAADGTFLLTLAAKQQSTCNPTDKVDDRAVI